MENIDADSGGLQDAIKLVFSEHQGEWLTASNVRDCLTQMGFDLRHYQANPLASIGTTLKRMAPAYLESKTSESGPTLYKRPAIMQNAVAARVLAEAERKVTPGELKRQLESGLPARERFKAAHDAKMAREKAENTK